MALCHKWGDKNAFTFSLMLISDSLVGVRVYHIYKSSLFFFEKGRYIFHDTYLTSKFMMRIGITTKKHKKNIMLNMSYGNWFVDGPSSG